jgi:mono/diheme cytochrome c family protein
MTATKFRCVSLFTLGLALVVLSSCQRNPEDKGWEFAPQMYRSVPYEPLKQVEGDKNKFNPYGMNMRLPVKGTVIRKINQNPYAQGLANDLMVYNIPKDSIEVSERVLKNPFPSNDSTLAQGKVLYGNVCQPCHGATGKGDGTVGKVYKGVPNYSAGAYKEMNDGHIFHTITYGRGRMWPHGSQLTPEERWLIVLYVHELQKQ